jgi:hypothetical protein
VDEPGVERGAQKDLTGRPTAAYDSFIHGRIAQGLMYAYNVNLHKFVQNL